MSHRTRVVIQLAAAAVMLFWAYGGVDTEQLPRPVRVTVPLACCAWFVYFALTMKQGKRERRGFPVIPTARNRQP
jgi:hypothetical protein